MSSEISKMAWKQVRTVEGGVLPGAYQTSGGYVPEVFGAFREVLERNHLLGNTENKPDIHASASRLLTGHLFGPDASPSWVFERSEFEPGTVHRPALRARRDKMDFHQDGFPNHKRAVPMLGFVANVESTIITPIDNVEEQVFGQAKIGLPIDYNKIGFPDPEQLVIVDQSSELTHSSPLAPLTLPAGTIRSFGRATFSELDSPFVEKYIQQILNQISAPC